MNFIFVWIPKSVGTQSLLLYQLIFFFSLSADKRFFFHILRESVVGLAFQQCHETTPKSIVFKIDLPQMLSHREAYTRGSYLQNTLLFDPSSETE